MRHGPECPCDNCHEYTAMERLFARLVYVLAAAGAGLLVWRLA